MLPIKQGRDSSGLAPVHQVVSLLKRWLLGTHHGAVTHEHLEYYLDEFTFRSTGVVRSILEISDRISLGYTTTLRVAHDTILDVPPCSDPDDL